MAARRADARSGLPEDIEPGSGGVPTGGVQHNGAPDPLTHGTPDAELAEAQLAAGRGEDFDELQTPEEERELEELATAGAAGAGEPSAAQTTPDRPSRGQDRGQSRAELDAAPSAAVARKPSAVARLNTFLRGSWAELQRVQWPDRRQVMQATGVVVGFVIIAGAFLGVADWAAGKLMDFILR